MADKHTWNERYGAKELVWSAGPNELFAREIENLAPGKALDLACGEGRNAIYLAEQGWDTTAIDFSDVGIDKGRQIAEKRGVKVNWVVDDVSSASLPEGEFDLVAVLFLHTSSEEREQWLPAAVAAVKAGGTFLYIGHDPSNITSGIGGPQDPAVLPTAHEVAGYLRDFEIELATVFERTVESDPGHGGAGDGIALDTFVRARRMNP